MNLNSLHNIAYATIDALHEAYITVFNAVGNNTYEIIGNDHDAFCDAYNVDPVGTYKKVIDKYVSIYGWGSLNAYLAQ